MRHPGSTFSVRSAVLLSTGDWVLIRNGEPVWYRPEALAELTAAKWSATFDSRIHTADLDREARSNPVSAYSQRLTRHIKDLQHLPPFVQDVPKGINKVLALVAGSQSKDHTNMVANTNKIIDVTTTNGRQIQIDVGNGGRIVSNTAARNQQDIRDAATKPSQDGRRDAHATRSYRMEQNTLQGRSHGSDLWRFVPKQNQRILAIHNHPDTEPVASIGKVLGDRNVLYKYLNENTILVTTANDQINKLSVYLLDSFSGSVLYSADHGGVDLSQPIPAALAENWLCYSYATDTPDQESARGYELTVAELYESELPNDRGPLEFLSSFNSTSPNSMTQRVGKPFVVSQSFKVPELISDMAVTQTTQGITSRQLLVSVPASNSVVGIPRQLLDPRRPVGADPNAIQAEEGLVRYVPNLDFDPRWNLNHKDEILDVQKMMTTPTGLESTSLVFAYGHDLFGTKVSPSFPFDILGNSFNKLQLILTVAALTIGVFFVAPLVKRKQTNMLWQSS